MRFESVLRASLIAIATLRDLARRPGAWLALVGTAILLAVLPGVARRALDAGPALGVELTLSTIWLHAGLFAAFAAVRASSLEAPMGPSQELLVTPLSTGEYVIGRTVGVTLASLLHAACLLLVGALSLALGGGGGVLAGTGGALLLGAAQTALLAAAGIACGALLGDTMGLVAVVLVLVAGRLAGPALGADLAAAGWWVLDLARLDVSRAAGFARPVGPGAIATACLAAAIQAAGCLFLARWALARGASGEGR